MQGCCYLNSINNSTSNLEMDTLHTLLFSIVSGSGEVTFDITYLVSASLTLKNIHSSIIIHDVFCSLVHGGTMGLKINSMCLYVPLPSVKNFSHPIITTDSLFIPCFSTSPGYITAFVISTWEHTEVLFSHGSTSVLFLPSFSVR